MLALFLAVIAQVDKMLADTDISKAYASGDSTIQGFVRHLALFISSFLKNHLTILERAAAGGDANAGKQTLLLSTFASIVVFIYSLFCRGV
jgi:hypothetical protein